MPKRMVWPIRLKKEAPETLVDQCGHPGLLSLHLRVTPISGCDGFELDPREARDARSDPGWGTKTPV
jgi:hypothetical protein